MILKIINETTNERIEETTFYDNIETATCYYNEAEKCNMVICAIKGGNTINVKITKKAYLCNDNGKTIETLLPSIQEQ